MHFNFVDRHGSKVVISTTTITPSIVTDTKPDTVEPMFSPVPWWWAQEQCGTVLGTIEFCCTSKRNDPKPVSEKAQTEMSETVGWCTPNVFFLVMKQLPTTVLYRSPTCRLTLKLTAALVLCEGFSSDVFLGRPTSLALSLSSRRCAPAAGSSFTRSIGRSVVLSVLSAGSSTVSSALLKGSSAGGWKKFEEIFRPHLFRYSARELYERNHVKAQTSAHVRTLSPTR